MACFTKGRFDPRRDLDCFIIFDRREVRECILGIAGGIKGVIWIRAFSAFLFVSLAFVPGVFFLDFCRIEQNDPGNLGGCVGAVYLAFESVSDEFGQKAAMVEM